MIALGLLTGLISGLIATLIAGNPRLRFRAERAVRITLGRPLCSTSFSTWVNLCSDGDLVLLHCVDIKNSMWLNHVIPGAYLLSYGRFPNDSYAYKPCIYFREHGLYGLDRTVTADELLKHYSAQIAPYAVDDPAKRIDVSNSVEKRIVALCEVTRRKDLSDSEGGTAPLNAIHPVGRLYAGVHDPMPEVSPGDTWSISIISEEFGTVDAFFLRVPADLATQESLGDTREVISIRARPPCLMDICHDALLLTWPLRLAILRDGRVQSTPLRTRHR